MWHLWGEKRHAYRFWWGNLRERDHLEDLGMEFIEKTNKCPLDL
jgi:hypothetical protein